MALLRIPVRPSLKSYQFRIDLDGKTYQFKFTWNPRAEQWSCVLSNSTGTVLKAFPILAGVDLLGRFKDENLPPGNLFVFDTREENIDPTFENFGDRHRLLYNEAI